MIKGFFDNVNHKKLIRQIWSLGIRDLRFLKIIQLMLKAPIKDEGIPSKGVPQGGILSPLLANICLNELDWWLSNQWETFETKHTYSGIPNRYNAIKKSRLKQFFFVRYADDLKIFCRNRKTAVKLLYALKDWLKNRLKLEISPEKSGIIDLRKKGSAFLGLNLRAVRKRNSFVCISHVCKKAIGRMCSDLKAQIKKIKKHQTPANINKYNSMVLGFHNYYNAATRCSLDFCKIAYGVNRTLHNRLGKFKAKPNNIKAIKVSNRFRTSAKLYVVNDIALFPIQSVKHKTLYNFTQTDTPYSEIGRIKIHKRLNSIITNGVLKIADNPIMDETVEYNDNRISKWAAQCGKCYITGEYLSNHFDCHHINPRYLGGNDRFNNLVISEVHKLLHSNDNLKSQLIYHEITGNKLKKFNNLRKAAHLEELSIN